MFRMHSRTLVLDLVTFGLISSMAFAQPQSAPNLQLNESHPVNVGEQNRLQFNFLGASWNEVLDWFVKEAKLNMEWRELPSGEFNLKTESTYSVSESLDIINMHLLARGFTLLRRDEVLVLIKLEENFDTTLVPRIPLEQLDARSSFDFVKVSFALDWLLAGATVAELSPMLSPYGKLVALEKTNCIEAMDSASNLRAIRDLIQREESGNSQERLVSEFVLQHTNATEMIGKLQQLLGMEKPLARMSNNQMQVVREQFAFKAEMAKRLGDKSPNFQESRTDIFLVANEQKNSIVANAPPDKIAVIKQAVQTLDVPSTNPGVQLSQITTMKVYPLNGADPDAVSDILQDLTEIGELHPSARFSEDDDKQILFAYASLKDHVTITSVMDQLAGSSRSFRVVQLKRLKAAYVARSIQTLMGAEVTNASVDGDRDRRGRNEPVSTWKGFKVDADLPHNRLLMFATTTEFAQVEELLVKIGERDRLSANTRVIKLPAESIDDMIERLRQQWPGVSDNPLEIQLPGKLDPSQDATAEPLKTTKLSSSKPTALVGFTQSPGSETSASRIQPQAGFAEPTPEDLLAPGPAIVLRKSAENELVLSSKDAVALEQVEGMLADYLPESAPFTSFKVQFASPYDVVINLREVLGTDSFGNPLPIKLIADEATHSIMVLGAGASELREIEQLIQFYDKAIELPPLNVRKPRFFALKHIDAAAAVQVVKDLYRDYLSATDRSLAPRNGERPSSAFSNPKQGLLSMGVSANVNTVVVSAPDFLAEEIAITIAELDIPDAKQVIRTIPLEDGVNSVETIRHLVQLLRPPTNAVPNYSNEPSRGNQDRANSEDRSAQDSGRSFQTSDSISTPNYGARSQVVPLLRSQQFPSSPSGSRQRR